MAFAPLISSLFLRGDERNQPLPGTYHHRARSIGRSGGRLALRWGTPLGPGWRETSSSLHLYQSILSRKSRPQRALQTYRLVEPLVRPSYSPQCFVYLIVALCVQKKGQIHFLADKAVLKKKKFHVTLGFLALLASLAALIFGGIYSSNNEDTPLGLVSLLIGLVGMIASIIYLSRAGNTLRASKYQDGWFRLAGCEKTFLDSLRATERC